MTCVRACGSAAPMTYNSLATSLVAPVDSRFETTDGAPLAAAPAATGWFTPALLAVSAVTLGLALHVNFGQFHPAAMPWLTYSLVACAAAAVVPNFGRLRLAA